MQYRENNTLFGNVKRFGTKLNMTGPITTYGKYEVDDEGYIEHHDYDYIVNAIDIHWGGAQLPNTGKTINTTAELLELIDSISPTALNNFATVQSVNDANQRILDLRHEVESLEIPSIEGLAHESDVVPLTFRINDLYDIVANLNIPSTEGLLSVDDAIATYLTKDAAEYTYQPKGEYASRIDVEQLNARFDDIEFPDMSRYVTNTNLAVQLSGYARTTDVGNMIMSFVDNAPEAFDTLKEIATWIDNHQSTALLMNEEINKKAYKTEIADMLTKTEAARTYLTKSEYNNDKENFATKAQLERIDTALQELEIPSISGLVHDSDIADMLTKTEAAETYLTEHQDISNLVTKEELNELANLVNNLDIPSIEGLATEEYVDNSIEQLNNSIVDNAPEGYDTLNSMKNSFDDRFRATDSLVNSLRILVNTKVSMSDLGLYALKSDLPSLDNYATFDDLANAIQTLINGAGESLDTFGEIEHWINDHVGSASQSNQRIQQLENENATLKEELRLIKESLSKIGGETLWDAYNYDDIMKHISYLNATINLKDNIVIHRKIDLPINYQSGNTTINLNDKNISFVYDGTETLEYAISLSSGQTLTINGNGKIEHTVENSPIFLLAELNGYDYDDSFFEDYVPILNIYGGTYIVNNPDEDDSTISNDFASIIKCDYGFVNIYGGTFMSIDKPAYLLMSDIVNVSQGLSKILVYGGTFYDFDPSDNSTIGHHTNYLANGYKCISEIVEIDGILHTKYDVVKE